MRVLGRMVFRPEAHLRTAVASIVAAQTSRIASLLPDARVEHIGGTSIPEALTKGDVDLMVIVANAEAFALATAALGTIFEINQPQNWTATFASYKDDTSLALSFGVQVVVRNSVDDHFITLRDRLRTDSEALCGYNAMKRFHEGGSESDYRRAKSEFVERLLGTGRA
jgi:GrpB-like predicted nucleotidyltransferase (UPF0157 family)